MQRRGHFGDQSWVAVAVSQHVMAEQNVGKLRGHPRHRRPGFEEGISLAIEAPKVVRHPDGVEVLECGWQDVIDLVLHDGHMVAFRRADHWCNPAKFQRSHGCSLPRANRAIPGSGSIAGNLAPPWTKTKVVPRSARDARGRDLGHEGPVGPRNADRPRSCALDSLPTKPP